MDHALTSGRLDAVEPDRPDFVAFYEAHRDRLYRALWLMTRDAHDADELSQEAFLRLWERWDRVSGVADPEGYLYRTAMNLFRNRRRRAVLALRRAVGAAPRDELEQVEARDTILRAMDALTPAQRAALVLTDLLDLTSEEAASALRVRPSTVRVLAARGRATLRDRLGGLDD
jgi:RNA polymerase sigma-70 factor (ECF subfamily)